MKVDNRLTTMINSVVLTYDDIYSHAGRSILKIHDSFL